MVLCTAIGPHRHCKGHLDKPGNDIGQACSQRDKPCQVLGTSHGASICNIQFFTVFLQRWSWLNYVVAGLIKCCAERMRAHTLSFSGKGDSWV